KTIVLNVAPTNNLPVANTDSYTTAEDTPLNRPMLTNDTDAEDGEPHAIGKINGSAVAVNDDVGITGGLLHVNADGTLTFTPTLNFNGPASFTYTAKDSAGAQSAPANVSITVTAVNDPPAITAPSSAS